MNGIDKVVWLDANPELVAQMNREKPHLKVVVAGVDETDGAKKELQVTNNLHSSSFLPLGTHKTEHPEIEVVKSISCSTITLDTIATQHPEIKSFNFRT